MTDKLNAEHKALMDGEKNIGGEVNSMVKEIDKKLSQLMILADRVIFEYDGVKEDITKIVGKELAEAWNKKNDGMINYADQIQKQIVDVRKSLKSVSYK